MAALPMLNYGLDKLYLFPNYQTREAYRLATGQEAPPFDPSRPPKCWKDPAAATSAKRSMVYENVLAETEYGTALAGPDGKPYLEPLVLSRQEAASVNLPYGETANEEGAAVAAVPHPLRPLDPDEELIFGFGGIVLVQNRKIAESQVEGFTAADHEVLRAIARKLNVPL